MQSRLPERSDAERRLTSFATRRWSALMTLNEHERRRHLSEMLGVALSVPLAAAGLCWLIASTDLALARREWATLVLLIILSALFNQLSFFQFFERLPGDYDWAQATLQPIVVASAVLLFGPTGIWLDVVSETASLLYDWRRHPGALQRWNAVRNRLFNIATSTLGFLSGIWFYRRLGGRFPLPALTLAEALPAAVLVAFAFCFPVVFFAAYVLIGRRLGLSRSAGSSIVGYTRFLVVGVLPPFSFAILAAAIYRQMGVAAYLFLMIGALLTSLLAQRLSGAAQRSQRRSRELGQLEQLGRALLAAPPDPAALPGILAEHVPKMFLYDQIEIRLLTGQLLLFTPAYASPAAPAFWTWARSAGTAHSFTIGQALPWSDQPADHPLAVAAIVGSASSAPLGGIYIALSELFTAPASVLPALQALAAQIAAALHRADEYQRDLAYQRVSQELALAAQIQASFLPAALPSVAGWQIAAALKPALETSGDFYDVLELPDGRVGLLVADVADKGTGAALFMALSRTLIRTYAFEYPDAPEAALGAANRRMLTDAHTSLFVTAFYGVLDPRTGRLTYANAGHNPPYLFQRSGNYEVQRLSNTGVPLGIEEELTWRACSVTLAPGDTLVLYTDGVNEAQDQHGAFFDESRLRATVARSLGGSAVHVQTALLDAVEAFAAGAPQSDDITVMVVVRERRSHDA